MFSIFGSKLHLDKIIDTDSPNIYINGNDNVVNLAYSSNQGRLKMFIKLLESSSKDEWKQKIEEWYKDKFKEITLPEKEDLLTIREYIDKNLAISKKEILRLRAEGKDHLA